MAPRGQVVRQKGLTLTIIQMRKEKRMIILRTKRPPRDERRLGFNMRKGIPASNVPAGQSLVNQGSSVR
jgi:hypothetical protein